jgi:hypothetical protein
VYKKRQGNTKDLACFHDLMEHKFLFADDISFKDNKLLLIRDKQIQTTIVMDSNKVVIQQQGNQDTLSLKITAFTPFYLKERTSQKEKIEKVFYTVHSNGQDYSYWLKKEYGADFYMNKDEAE